MSNEFLEALSEIVRRAYQSDTAQGQQKLRAILTVGVNSFEDLLRILQKEDVTEEIIATACWFLGRLGDKRSFESLITALSHKSPTVRKSAAIALQGLESKEAVQPLINMLNDESTDVREAVAYALGWLGYSPSVEPLIKVIEDKNEDSRVRGMAAEALGNIGLKQAVKPLIQALSDSSVELRFWASFALGKLGDILAIPELERLVAEDRAVLPEHGPLSREAADAIKAIKRRQAESGKND